MPVTLIKSANFGRRGRGLTTVGYTIYDNEGNESQARTTSDIIELQVDAQPSGTFSASIDFSDDFRGTIVWDTGTPLAKRLYAIEQYNEIENSPDIASIKTTVEANAANLDEVKTSVKFTEQMTSGRWSIDTTNKTMTFFDDDNITEVAKFSLLNKSLVLDTEEVFHRLRNDNDTPIADLVEEAFSEPGSE